MLGDPLVTHGRPLKAAIDGLRTLRIEGTDAAETIIAEVSGDPAFITIDHRETGGTDPPVTVSYPLDSFDRLVINARGGADFVNIIDARELLEAQNKTLTLDSGTGDNVVVVSHLPFKLETATQVMHLLDLSKQIEDVAKRASEATIQALAIDALKLIESVRVNIADASRGMAKDAETQLFDPARRLLEVDGPRLTALGESIIAQSDAFAGQHGLFIAELVKNYCPPNGVWPPADEEDEGPPPGLRDAECPDTDVPKEAEMDTVEARADELAQTGEKLGGEAKTQIEKMGKQIEIDAGIIEQRAAEFEKRAEQLAAKAEALAVQGEEDMTAAADRVLAVVGELQSMEKNFQEAGMALRGEIELALALARQRQAPPAPPGAPDCDTPIETEHENTGDGFFFPAAAPAKPWLITGGTGTDILIGGFNTDEIHGGAGNDIICGFGGNDQINGDEGTDLLIGEFFIEILLITGDDCINGDKGIDLVIGDNFISDPSGTGGGDDSLEGDEGIDIIIGDDVLPDIFSQTLPGGSDEMDGDDDIDLLVGCGGADDIEGNEDIDFAEGNGGDDVIDGGDGREFPFCGTTIEIGNLLHGGKGADEVTGGDGIDVILGDEDRDKLTGEDQIDLMFGGGERDTMEGNEGGEICIISGVSIRLGNFMVGGPENDTMRAGGDLDVMLGIGGDDKIHGYDGGTQEAAAIDADVLLGGSGKDYLKGDDESFTLRLSDDFIFGGPGDDEMHGGKTIDFLFGGPDDDRMYGDSNALLLVASIDFMSGGPGNDTMDGGNSLDLMFGRDGNDTMLGDDETFGLISPDFMFGGSGVDTMNGGSSLDLMLGDDDADHMLGDSNHLWQPLSVDIMFGRSGSDYMDGGNSIDFMFGGPECDTMLGDDSTPVRISPDFMFGQTGDDDMDGGDSPDFMWGGPGNDRMVGDRQLGQPLSLDFMFGEDGAETMLGGQGFDLIVGGPGVDHIDGQLGPDVVIGGADSDTINGGDLLDLIWGNGGNDLIHGNDWPDFIRGGPGADCLYGDHGQDLISGGKENDCIHGGSHVDWIRGNEGDDLIFGDNGVDFLMGGFGSDRLDGGSFYDFIFGGPGQDEGWRGPGGGVFFSISTKHNGSSGLDCTCQIEEQKGRICVHKFNDFNGDGIQNNGEPPLQGWIFQVTPGCAGVTLITDVNGRSCADFFAGTYTVTEQLQNGWMATTPTVQVVRVTGGRTTDVSFGNKQAGCDLLISKSISPNPAQTGQQVNVSLTVTNVATVMCQSAPTVVKDPKPPGLTFNLPVTVTQTGGNANWTCGLGNPSGDLSCTTPNLLPPGYSATFTFTATVTAQPPGGVINCATVTNGNDVNPPNDQSCVTLALGCAGEIFGENFDGVNAPALPAQWVAENSPLGSNPPVWMTSTTTPNTGPNAAFIDDPATISDKFLYTPEIEISSASAQVTFRNNFDLQSGFDGGVLEASINAGPFNDITDPSPGSVGGTFVTGGYTAEISGATGNSLAGRPAWTGSSCGYICTVVDLSAGLNGQRVRFRFRMGSDQSVAGVGWRIDDFQVLQSGSVCGPCLPVTPSPASLLSISTQGRVGTGINVLVGGFTITGNQEKTVVIRGLGPSLVSSGISDFLADPTLELRDSSGMLLLANNNWQDDPVQAAELLAAGLAPTDNRESAIFVSLPSCASYTATLAGANGGTGIGKVEIYDVSQTTDSQLANVNTRGFVQTGGDRMIATFVVGGSSSNTRIAMRGIGPSLNTLIPFLADPALELQSPAIMNDNWLSNPTSATALILQGLALPNPSESGIFTSLAPGTYTVILSGKDGAGVSRVEIYNVH